MKRDEVEKKVRQAIPGGSTWYPDKGQVANAIMALFDALSSPEKSDSLVGLECSRCDVKWVGENVGSAQGWARMSANPWDWHCPDCAKVKPKVYTCLPKITTEMPKPAPVSTDAEKELVEAEKFTESDEIHAAGSRYPRWDSVRRERAAAARVIGELKALFKSAEDEWVHRAERAEASVKELEEQVDYWKRETFGQKNKKYDQQDRAELATRQRDAAVEGLKRIADDHLDSSGCFAGLNAKETLSQVEKMAGGGACSDAAPTGHPPPALSIPDAIAKCRQRVEVAAQSRIAQGDLMDNLAALNNTTDAELARLGKEVERLRGGLIERLDQLRVSCADAAKWKAWAGALLKSLMDATDPFHHDAGVIGRSRAAGIVPGEEPK